MTISVKPFLLLMVPKAGLEPARVSPLPPQDSVSTKFHHFGKSYAIILFGPAFWIEHRAIQSGRLQVGKLSVLWVPFY